MAGLQPFGSESFRNETVRPRMPSPSRDGGHFVPPSPATVTGPWAARLRQVMHNPLSAFPADVYEQPIVTVKRFGQATHFVADPTLLRAVLGDRDKRYGKSRLQRRLLGSLLGQGLLAAEGDLWRQRRLHVAPLFQPDALRGRVPRLRERVAAAVALWGDQQQPFTIDLENAIRRLVFEALAEIIGGPAMVQEAEDLRRDLDHYLAVMGQPDIADALNLPPLLPKAGAASARRALLRFRRTLQRLVKDRSDHSRYGTTGGHHLLDVLLSVAPHHTQGDGDAVVDELATFLFAGHEATATAAAWMLYLLTVYPQWMDRLRTEMADHDIMDLPLGIKGRDYVIGQIFTETLRLYPPSLILARDSLSDHHLHDTPIATGDSLLISPWILHRHRALWRDADMFDPLRFAPGGDAPDDRFAWLPFGGGPHVCIGAQLAELIVRLIVETVCWRYDSAVVPTARPIPLARITLKADGGLPVVLSPRAQVL